MLGRFTATSSNTVTQPGSRSAATTLPRSSGSATPTESSPAGGCPQLTAQQCTQTPQSGVERPDPPICVHSCDPKATHSPSPQFNSVHKRPKLAQRAPILSSVYTIAATRGRPRHNSVHKCPKSTAERPTSPICIHFCGPPESPATQQCTQTPQIGTERPDPPICVHYRGPPGATHNSIVYTNAPKVQQKSHREFGTSSHLSCLSKNAAILSNGMASFPPPS